MKEVAESWEDVPEVIDSRKARATHIVHGIARTHCGNEVGMDFGNEAPITFAKITFKDSDAAWLAYCNGIRLEVKVVDHPERKEKEK